MAGPHECAPLTELPRLTRSQEPGPGESSEPGAGLQSVWRHQQRETLRHLRLQRLQRVLQAQREEEAHLQVRQRQRCMMGNRGSFIQRLDFGSTGARLVPACVRWTKPIGTSARRVG